VKRYNVFASSLIKDLAELSVSFISILFILQNYFYGFCQKFENIEIHFTKLNKMIKFIILRFVKETNKEKNIYM